MRTRWAVVVACLLLLAAVAGSGALAAEEAELPGRWGLPPDAVTADGVVDSLAAASADALQRTSHGERRLLVLTRLEEEQFVDVGAEQFSPGDYVVFTERLFNQRGTRELGTSTAQCTFVFDRNLCQGTFSLAGGDLEVEGTLQFVDLDRPPRLAVTGGTGRFRNVTGDARLRFFEDTPDVLFVFRLER